MFYALAERLGWTPEQVLDLTHAQLTNYFEHCEAENNKDKERKTKDDMKKSLFPNAGPNMKRRMM